MNSITWLRIHSRGWHNTYHQRSALHSMGYTFDPTKKEWVKQAADDDIETAQLFCKKYGFNLVIDLPQFRRSSDYREIFFHAHPGFGKGEHYFCSYCGHLMNKDKTTVDHLIAVDTVQKSNAAKGILKHFGIENVNDSKNLVPACMRCNQRKGKKTGLWVLRGLIGSHAGFWFVFWPIFLSCFIAAVIIALQIDLPLIFRLFNYIKK